MRNSRAPAVRAEGSGWITEPFFRRISDTICLTCSRVSVGKGVPRQAPRFPYSAAEPPRSRRSFPPQHTEHNTRTTPSGEKTAEVVTGGSTRVKEQPATNSEGCAKKAIDLDDIAPIRSTMHWRCSGKCKKICY